VIFTFCPQTARVRRAKMSDELQVPMASVTVWSIVRPAARNGWKGMKTFADPNNRHAWNLVHGILYDCQRKRVRDRAYAAPEVDELCIVFHSHS
jgi:hypothetical protein